MALTSTSLKRELLPEQTKESSVQNWYEDLVKQRRLDGFNVNESSFNKQFIIQNIR